jgi:DNA-binding MarR family transcriptional regulator
MIKNDVKTLPVRDLWALLDRTRFAISRLRELELAQFGLTIEQSSILYILTLHSGFVTVKDLEDITMRRQHSVSALINGIVKMGLVSKVKNPGEKRFKIGMTGEGEELFKRITISSMAKIFSSLGVTERQQLVNCLKPLLERGRYLMGIQYKPPILQYLTGKNPEKTAEQSPDVDSLTEMSLWSLLERTNFAISRLREIELAQFNITIEQASILYFLTLRGETITTKELEDFTMRQHHSISVLLSGMVKMGLVSELRNPGEKRLRISMTREGEELYKKVTDASIEKPFAILTAKERHQLAACLYLLLGRSRTLLGISD